MASFNGLLERKLGVQAIWKDHVDSWSDAKGDAAKSERRRWAAWYFGVPAIPAIVFVFVELRLQGVGQILAGTAVFTSLLFGLLGVVFNMGVTLRKDGAQFPNAHNLPMVISDLRANITYAIVVGLVLSATLTAGAAVSNPACGLGHWWTPVITWLFAHLGLTLLLVLRRFRTAFNYITR